MIDVQMPDGRVTKTEAAASRWENLTIDWVEKTPEQKIATVIKIIFGGQWEYGLNFFAFTMCFIIISIGMTVATIIRKILKVVSRKFRK